MLHFIEGALGFDFPDDWQVCPLDRTSFYKQRFQSFGKSAGGKGAKSVDFVAFAQRAKELWLIEVKDYRQGPREKPIDLVQEVAEKVRDSLACIHAMAANAGGDDQTFARQALRRPRIRIVLHLEQPSKPSRLKPVAVPSVDLKQKIQQALRAVDPHALAGGKDVLNLKTPWQVR